MNTAWTIDLAEEITMIWQGTQDDEDTPLPPDLITGILDKHTEHIKEVVYLTIGDMIAGYLAD